jgi:hypothetical protein
MKFAAEEVNTESTVETTTHKLEKYEWDEGIKSEFPCAMDSSINEYCMYEIIFYRSKINDVIIFFMFW